MCPLKVGDVLISNLEPDMKFDAKRDFRFDVAINKPQVIERKPLIETLQYFCDLIGGIATSFRPCLA